MRQGTRVPALKRNSRIFEEAIMAASTLWHIQYGSAPGTDDISPPGCYFCATNVQSTIANRDASPVVVTGGTDYSYERWLRLEWDSGSATQLDTFRHYNSAATPTGVTLNTSAQNPSIDTATYTSPVVTVSPKGTVAMLTSDPGATEYIQGTLTAASQLTEYAVMQAVVTATATAGFTLTQTWAWAETA
jgi:hypothetical protein